MFTENFRSYASAGDSIECPVILAGRRTGLRLVATLYDDDDKTPPDERQDGYWPSLDPNSAGYIGAKSESTLWRHTKRATKTLQAWHDDEWFYVGVCVRAYFGDTELTGEFEHALWGVDCNYPGKHGNAYLLECANDLAGECARDAIRALTDIVEAGAAELESIA